MYSTKTEQFDLSYSDRAPIILCATSEAAFDRAAGAVEASGCRVERVALETARQRIERQIAATAVWLELDRDCGSVMDDFLEYVGRNVAGGRFPAVVSCTPELIDAISARIDQAHIDLIVDAEEADRAAALALATARGGMSTTLSDVASERSAERLRQLSDEVGRIAATLARLSAGPGAAAPAKLEPVHEPEAPDISAETVRAVIRARRLRNRFFPEDLFADPAWDMLLDLLQAEIGHLRVPVSSLCIAAAVPATTALRWLKSMVQQGLFVRRADPHDGRRVFVELAPETSRTLRRYFAEVGNPAVI